ncbi:MAG: nucleotidyltransferase domain-containing protein [Candidatus Auribacterota bacterium]|nr:nucleotidyltransferase domain-containing protein [Candidatus Auribacterota bacterium]
MTKKKKKKIPTGLQGWIVAKKRFHLSNAHIQMARELGMNPKKLGGKANHKQERWKAPLPDFIESLYFKRFGKERPDTVKSIEQIIEDRKRKKEYRKQKKRLKQEEWNNELSGSNTIPPQIRESILNELLKIEREEEVAIFYACESGSRAWGFESEDSDYDVRFLYIHPSKWYLSVENGRDVIERNDTGDLDISGWDIRKALILLRKSNPSLLEWLRSPIVYRRRYSIIDHIRKLAPEYYSPRSSMYHYLHMAEGNYRKYLQGDEVRLKKYFYVLRPILACIWIERDLGVAPLSFETLVDSLINDQDLKSSIANLLVKKRGCLELDQGPKIPIINHFIEEELKRLSEENKYRPALASNPFKLDELFHNALAQIWGKKI